MGIKDLYGKIRHNHALMMIVCCAVPLIILLGAVYFFGLSKSYLVWFIILLCPLMHYFMMKDMHKDHEGNKTGRKGKGACH